MYSQKGKNGAFQLVEVKAALALGYKLFFVEIVTFYALFTGFPKVAFNRLIISLCHKYSINQCTFYSFPQRKGSPIHTHWMKNFLWTMSEFFETPLHLKGSLIDSKDRIQFVFKAD